MKRSNKTAAENWLTPVSQQAFEKFVKEVAGLLLLENTDRCLNIGASRFFVAQGHFLKNFEERHGSLYLGEYGPVMHDDENNIGKTDFDRIVRLNELHPIMQEIYIEWIKLVAKANKGRLIHGKTYLQTLQEEANDYICIARDEMIQSIVGKANKQTVDLVKLLNEVSTYNDDENSI